MMQRSRWVMAGTGTLAALALAAPAAHGAPIPGLQTVKKHKAPKSANPISNGRSANPMIALLPNPATSDLAYWRSAMKQRAAARAKQAPQSPLQRRAAAVDPLLVDETEPDGIRGGNDTPDNAQAIPAFGSAAGLRPAARVLGTLAPGPESESFEAADEDDGSIPLSGESELDGAGSVTDTEATIGDGPHGADGDGTGDFDFYAVRDALAGQRLVVDIGTAGSALDSMLVLYDADGEVVASNDDADGLDSLLDFVLRADGDYYVSVTGYETVQADPHDSGSGDGAGSEGAYSVEFALEVAEDVDVYAVDLQEGDVLAASLTGEATSLSLLGPGEREVFGSTQDASALYPASSPLPGGGNAVGEHVAPSDRAPLRGHLRR